MKKVVIVGGGITGLTTALDTREAAAAAGMEVQITVLEASSTPGGNIRTDRTDGYTIENGPNGFLDNAPKTMQLVRRIGLEEQLQKADEAAARRFIYRNGRLHEAPTGPLSFVRSSLLSVRGRLRVLAEPFARSRPHGVDETVHAFATRRLGPEAACILVDAMVSGVFAGNVHELSLASSFPKMAKMEADYGGLVRAMVGRMKERKAARREAEERELRGENVAELSRPGGPAGPGGTLTSFRRGLDTLIEHLVDALGPAELRTDARVASIEMLGSDAGAARAWRVRLVSGELLEADAVVLTIPAPRAAPLLKAADPELAAVVAEIETAGLAVVATAYNSADIPPVDGFGFLVPRGQGVRILGCLWDSSIFPDRAPGGKVLLRSMIGGAHDPGAVSDDEAVLVADVRRDLTATMGIEAEPELTRVYRWPLGIGQYHVGHQERLRRIHGRLRSNPGLWVAGSSYYGVSMNACIAKAAEQGRQIVAYLAG